MQALKHFKVNEIQHPLLTTECNFQGSVFPEKHGLFPLFQELTWKDIGFGQIKSIFVPIHDNLIIWSRDKQYLAILYGPTTINNTNTLLLNWHRTDNTKCYIDELSQGCHGKIEWRDHKNNDKIQIGCIQLRRLNPHKHINKLLSRNHDVHKHTNTHHDSYISTTCESEPHKSSKECNCYHALKQFNEQFPNLTRHKYVHLMANSCHHQQSLTPSEIDFHPPGQSQVACRDMVNEIVLKHEDVPDHIACGGELFNLKEQKAKINDKKLSTESTSWVLIFSLILFVLLLALFTFVHIRNKRM